MEVMHQMIMETMGVFIFMINYISLTMYFLPM